MTMSDLSESIWELTIPVRVAKLLKENGMEQAFQNILEEYSIDCDGEYWVSIYALENLCDHVENDYDEQEEIVTMYFSDRTVMEYYRLCQDEARLTQVPFSETPSVKQAEENVRKCLDVPECYYCGYWLRVEPEEEWGYGIVFEYDASYFYEFYALLSRMVQVLVFYRENLPALRREVDQLKRPFAIVPYQPKGAAA